MTIALGASLNAAGILLGGFFGLARREPIPARTQIVFRNAIGALTVFFGLRLVYESVGGTFSTVLKQLFLAVLAVVLGNALGRLLRLQTISNRLGRTAGNAIATAQKNGPVAAADGFNACVVLFCAAPLGIIGAVTDGLSNYFQLLAVKAVMDALAMASFVKIFRWPSALSAAPVFVFFSVLSLTCQVYVAPFLNGHGLTHSVNAAAGLVACVVAVVVFQIRKVALADYLPALVVAPLLAGLQLRL